MKTKFSLRYFIEIAIIAVVYHLAARLGLQMAYVQQNTSPVWPPSGIALAALLLLGIRYWPGVALGIVVGSFLNNTPIQLSIGFGLANTLEALIGAYILKRWVNFDIGIHRIRDVFGLVGASACGTAISATIGVITLILTRNVPPAAFLNLAIVWFIGNLLGCLVVTPLLLTWTRFLLSKSIRDWHRSHIAEAIVFLISLILVTLYIFQNPSGGEALHQALIYVIFPFAIWAALRMEQVGAATTIFVVSSVAIWGSIHGLGPFARIPLTDSLILLQTFTGIVALISLMLAASSSERRQAEATLRKQVDELGALNDASKQFLANIDKQTLYRAICQLAVERFGLSDAFIFLTTPDDDCHAIAAQPSVNPPISIADHPHLSEQLRTVQKNKQAVMILTGETTPTGIFGRRSSQMEKPLASFPLLYGKQLEGILTVSSQDPGSFSKEHCLLLQSYANLAAAAIQNSSLFEQVRLGNEQLHALSHRLMEVQEAERIHLSRELHDELGQIVAALMVNLGLVERDAKYPDLIRTHTQELKHIATEVQDDLHALAVNLRPASLDHLGLVMAMNQYIQEFNRQYQMEVQFETVGIDESRLPNEIETALFRIVQESLTNVALHAKASRVDVLLNKRNGCLILTVEDNGIGFQLNEPSYPGRLGLFGMRERVEMLDGKFVVESAPGKGTMISVEVPYANSGLNR